MDHFQKSNADRLLLSRALPTGEGMSSMEAQLSGYGVKGFRDRLGELFLAKLDQGFFPKEVEINRVTSVQEFESRFESFSTLGDYRVFMLGLYLKMKDYESFQMFGRQTSFLSIPLEVDEILAASDSKTQKLDWMIVILNSLLKFWSKEFIMEISKDGPQAIVDRIRGLEDKSKLIFLNDLSSYGFAINENDIFLYQKV